MSSEQRASRGPAGGRPRLKTRAATVGVAVGLAVAVWAVAQAAGIDVQAPEMGDEPVADVTAVHVTLAAAVASLAGWGLLEVLERLTGRARRVWAVVAGAALVLSLGAPVTGPGIGAANRVVLAALHLVVGGVIIAGLLRTASSPTPSARR